MIKPISCFIYLSLTIAFCSRNKQNSIVHPVPIPPASMDFQTIGEIVIPSGYERVPVGKDSFGKWLRNVKLKKDSRIHLYDGRLKYNQSSQFAVLDITVGNKDLQQCADAILRLRAEYFYDQNNMDMIRFKATDGTELSFARWLKGERYKLSRDKLLPYISGKSVSNKRIQLEQFLEVVFAYCGTISLGKETHLVSDPNDIQIGDVFVKAGSPGHAMIIVDIAINRKGEKIFMLAQGLMPAQDIHIVRNLIDEKISPWYKFTSDPKIITPQWVFYRNELKTW